MFVLQRSFETPNAYFYVLFLLLVFAEACKYLERRKISEQELLDLANGKGLYKGLYKR